MNELPQHRRIEDDLARALNDAAVRAVPETETPPPFVETRKPQAHVRWMLPLMSAAAVLVLVGGTLVTAQLVSADRSHSPDKSLASPTGTPSPTDPPTSTPTTSPTETPSTPSATSHSTTTPTKSDASTSPAVPIVTTKLLSTAAGSFTVPSTWAVAAGAPSSTVCITKDAAPYQAVGGGNNCELLVRSFSATSGDSTLAGGIVDPDRPGGFGGTDVCGSAGNAGITTDQSDDATVGAAAAEHRVFAGSCIQGSLEQWVVPTAPAVVITRWNGAADTDAAAASAVRSGQLAGNRGSVRLVDRGRVVSTEGSGGRWTVNIDRVVLGADGRVENNNSALYTYSEGYVGYPTGLVNIQYYANGKYQDLSPVGLSYLLAKTGFYDTLPPIENMIADITTDGNVVTRLVLHLP
ncbi:hypothetical protein ACSMXN_03130 [Jatrophihabitans sp. DSM 45814]